MTGSYYSITVVGTRRRLDLSLPADVPVGELAAELVLMLDEQVDGPPPRWGLVRLGGEVLDTERGLAAQHVPSGAMLFLRDTGEVIRPPAVDDYASAVAATVEASPGRWTPAGFQALLVLASAAWLLGGGAMAWLWLLAGATGDAEGFLAAALAAAIVAVVLGRALRFPLTGAALALAALPLWAAGGVGLAVGAGLGDTVAAAAGLGAVVLGVWAARAAAPQGAAPALGVAAAGVPWVLTLALFASIGVPVSFGAATLVPVLVTGLRLVPWIAVRIARLDGAAPADAVPSRTASARTLLGALTAGTAVALAGACVVLALQTSWWARALAVAGSLAALLHGRRRRFAVEVVPLVLVPLATTAAFELGLLTTPAGTLADWQRLTLVLGTSAALVALGLAGRTLSLPAGLRRQLDRLEGLAATSTGPLALGLLGLYDAAQQFAARFG